MINKNNTLLEVKNLEVKFFLKNKIIHAVNKVNFKVNRGEIVSFVGESGCGKSVTALSILRLIKPPGKIVNGKILFNGKDLLKLKEQEIRKIRGKDISIIFQDPMTSLNPVFKVGEQIREVITTHYPYISKKESKQMVIELLEKLKIPKERYNSYPFELSGGMRQRIMIAMAIILKPSLIIADEPTTALDISVQREIIDLLLKLKEELNLSIIFITHDLRIVNYISDRVYIMYAGKIIEEGNKDEIFRNPLHPYTQALLNSIPKIGGNRRLYSIPGSVLNLWNLPENCYFYNRCEKKIDLCKNKYPLYKTINENHKVACWLYDRN